MKTLRSYKLFERYTEPQVDMILKDRDLTFDVDNGLSAKDRDFSYIWHDSDVILSFYFIGGKYYVDFTDGRRFSISKLSLNKKPISYNHDDYRFINIYDTFDEAILFLNSIGINTTEVEYETH